MLLTDERVKVKNLTLATMTNDEKHNEAEGPCSKDRYFGSNQQQIFIHNDINAQPKINITLVTRRACTIR